MTKKKILFDLVGCQPNRESKFHGGGVYGYIVLSHLINKIPERLVVRLDKKRFVSPDIEKLIQTRNIQIVDLNDIGLLECVKKYDVGVFYSPLYSKAYKQLLQSDIPIMLTVHGLRNLEMNRDKTEILYARTLRDKIKALLKLTPYYNSLCKKYREEKKWLFESEKVHVITVSNHSRSSILYYYPSVKKERLNVLYSVSTTPADFELTKPYSPEKYYLIVSANRWLKNAYRAIMAFDSLFDNPQYGIEGKVIVLGLSKETSIYKRIKHKDHFELLGYVDQPTLESLYKGAYALVYPSLNEGFGYPPLEAMKYGTPVVASPFASVTEVCGEAVMYVNPYSIEEISNRILQLEDDELWNKHKKRGFERYKLIFQKQSEDLEKLCVMLMEKIDM